MLALRIVVTVAMIGMQPQRGPVVMVSRGSAARSQIVEIETVLGSFEVDNLRYPTTKEGLRALVQKPAGVKNWRGPYLPRVPTDPWGKPYVYRCPGQHDKEGYDLFSCGPDGKEGGGDDITSWSGR